MAEEFLVKESAPQGSAKSSPSSNNSGTVLPPLPDAMIIVPVRGMVLVFDPNGRFLRELGTFHGESLYERITSIAIDRKLGRLYLADGPRHLLVILDLEGNVIQRVGEGRIDSRPGELARRDPLGPKEFSYPIDIAIGAGKIAVLDSGGTRVRILDPDGKLVGSFSVQHAAEDQAAAIQMDGSGDADGAVEL